MDYLKKSFSVAPGSGASTENWERTFGKKDDRIYICQGRECKVLVRPSGRGGKGAPRNCLVKFLDTGEEVVRPFRGLRRKHDSQG